MFKVGQMVTMMPYKLITYKRVEISTMYKELCDKSGPIIKVDYVDGTLRVDFPDGRDRWIYMEWVSNLDIFDEDLFTL